MLVASEDATHDGQNRLRLINGFAVAHTAFCGREYDNLATVEIFS